VAEAPLILILVGLAAYTVLGGADFGAGLWELTGRGPGGQALRDHTHRAMAPVWEANHVWLIFVLVVCWTAYPPAFASITSTLTIPLFLAGIGIVLRGASYALRSGIDTPREEGVLSLVFALSSVLTPFALGATVGGIASARVPVGNARGDAFDSWLNPTSILIGTLAVATAAYLAAVYLAGDATRMGNRDVAEAFRTRALGAGIVAGAIAATGPFVLHSDARPLYDGLTSGTGLAALLVSAAAGIVTLTLVAARRYEPARLSAAAAVAAIVAGWGLAQRPSFLPGLSIDEAAANDATITALLIGFAVGLLILLPSLAYLFRLVLTGRFDPAAPMPPPPPRASSAAAALTSSRLESISAPIAAALLTLGALVTFFSEGWLLAVGVTLMLAGACALFLALVTAEDR